MSKQIPTRRFYPTKVSCRPAARAELTQVSDWILADIGLLRVTSALDSVKPFWMV